MRKRIVSGIVAALCVTSLLTGCAKESKLATTTVESKLATTTNATVKEVETQTVAAATPAKKTSTGKKTPVQRHGRLYVKGTHIKDKNHKDCLGFSKTEIHKHKHRNYTDNRCSPDKERTHLVTGFILSVVHN